MAKYLERLLTKTETLVVVFAVGAMVIIGILFLAILTDVTVRFTMSRSIEGVIEASEYMLVAIAFLALGYTQLAGMHVRVEGIISRFSPRLQSIINILILLLVIVFIVIMAQQIGKETYRAWADKAFHFGLTFQVPLWPLPLVAFIGCILLIISFLTQLFRNIIGLVAGKVVGFRTRA